MMTALNIQCPVDSVLRSHNSQTGVAVLRIGDAELARLSDIPGTTSMPVEVI